MFYRLKRISGAPKNLLAVRRVYSFYENRAKNRGIAFELTVLEIQELLQRDCIYCGAKPGNKVKLPHGKSYVYQGLDRVMNDEGYTKENSVPCCGKCNSIKSDILSPRQMIAAMRAIKKVK